MTVWIVTGEEHGIVCTERVFSTEALALNYLRNRPGGGEKAEMKEWTLDSDSPIAAWSVVMDRDGRLREVPRIDVAADGEHPWYHLDFALWGERDVRRSLICHVPGNDPQTAVDYANTIRAKLIATGEWK